MVHGLTGVSSRAKGVPPFFLRHSWSLAFSKMVFGDSLIVAPPSTAQCRGGLR